MAAVNRLFGGIRTVRRFVADEAKTIPPGRPLRVLDIGSGICDIPIAVCRWARRRGLDVDFTCLEISPHVAGIANQRIARAGLADRVRLVQEDAFAHRPAQPYDCAAGSMFFHHLADEAILRLVSHLRTCVRHSVLISDLGRNRPDYIGAWFLTRPLSPEVRYDALLSIRRSFKSFELERLLRQLPNAAVQASPAWLFRVKAIVRFLEGVNA